MNPPRKVLISRLSAHGDVIQTLPLLARLKAHDPTLFVGWLVEESAAPLLENHPLIDRLHVVPLKHWMRHLKALSFLGRTLDEIITFVAALRQERYEAALDVQGLLKSAVFPWLAGIPRRIGYAKTRENAALFYNETLPPHDLTDPTIPTVALFCELAQRLGVPVADRADPAGHDPELFSFPLPPVSQETEQKVDTLLAPLANRPLIAIAPATIWPSKHWEEASWPPVMNFITSQGFNGLIVGGPNDSELAARLFTQVKFPDRWLNLTGQTNWTDLYALFKRVDILVGLDSAPLHIANAVGHPRILGIYGPTGVRRTGPIGRQHRTLSTTLDCQPCFKRICPLSTHDCMHQLRPESVIDALGSLMNHVSAGKLPNPSTTGEGWG